MLTRSRESYGIEQDQEGGLARFLFGELVNRRSKYDKSKFETYLEEMPSVAYDIQQVDLAESIIELRGIVNKQGKVIQALIAWIHVNSDSWLEEFPLELEEMAFSLQIPRNLPQKKGKRK